MQRWRKTKKTNIFLQQKNISNKHTHKSERLKNCVPPWSQCPNPQHWLPFIDVITVIPCLCPLVGMWTSNLYYLRDSPNPYTTYHIHTSKLATTVDVLEAGKMGKRKDLSEGQRATLWWLEDRVRASPKLQLLWGVPGLQWLVSIKSDLWKEQWWTNDRVMSGQGSLMHLGSIGWPLWSDPTQLLLITLLKKLLLVLIERCKNTQCISVVAYWAA